MTLLTTTETAIRLKTTASQVRHLVKTDNDFPCLAYGSKSYRIIAEELDNWILLQRKKKIPVVVMKKKAEAASVILTQV
jgi:hypothetical protein